MLINTNNDVIIIIFKNFVKMYFIFEIIKNMRSMIKIILSIDYLYLFVALFSKNK